MELRSIHTIKVDPLNRVFGIIVLREVFPYWISWITWTLLTWNNWGSPDDHMETSRPRLEAHNGMSIWGAFPSNQTAIAS